MNPIRKRILIVEDEADLRDLLMWALARSDFEIAVAEDGETAIRKARSAIPDLVVLDLMLPKLDGFQVCRQLRAWPETTHVPVLVVSASAAPDSSTRSRECGANDFIAKPFSVRELVQRIYSALAA